MEKRKAALNLISLVGKQALYVSKEYLSYLSEKLFNKRRFRNIKNLS